MKMMDDKYVYDFLMRGNKRVFRKFYDDNSPKLRAYIQSRMSVVEDVEELMQDTYLAFLDSLPLFRGKEQLDHFFVCYCKA